MRWSSELMILTNRDYYRSIVNATLRGYCKKGKGFCNKGVKALCTRAFPQPTRACQNVVTRTNALSDFGWGALLSCTSNFSTLITEIWGTMGFGVMKGSTHSCRGKHTIARRAFLPRKSRNAQEKNRSGGDLDSKFKVAG